jgi:hypothetical protein
MAADGLDLAADIPAEQRAAALTTAAEPEPTTVVAAADTSAAVVVADTWAAAADTAAAVTGKLPHGKINKGRASARPFSFVRLRFGRPSRLLLCQCGISAGSA